MRIYSIDQLTEKDTSAIGERLKEMELQGGVEGVFWLPVPEAFFTPLQKEHRPVCGPYCLALVVEETSIHLELLVRGIGRISCQCLGFASEELRNHMIGFLEHMLSDLKISF